MPTSVITYGSGLEFFIFPVTQSVNRCSAEKTISQSLLQIMHGAVVAHTGVCS